MNTSIPSRPTHDLTVEQERWNAWVRSTSDLLGIDPAVVDISAIHDLTRTIARELDRPLAPVSSFMLGVAIGARGADADPAALTALIESTVHSDLHQR
ncbi:hypothetical protein KEM60_01228 [Austwickia sp. TVS 96-490-7B]|uniref:DUF6457 domain-containing protein n=1 Tax=Austwickia sp. TVS 96-490-7B TaxID=2830843 RepID=UPI001C5789A0|nr:DUF6457 domain-containing protein [Austwickia sp. TVS 96-490-7B]MBW3085036.1 hypothetical protein [Austwickia sp. TVS 96-490-7B]